MFTANVDPAGSAGPNTTISTGVPQQARTDVAAGADGYMLAFRSDVSGTNRIMIQPLDRNGDPLTPGPLQLDQGSLFNGPGTPSVAWNGALYFEVSAAGNDATALVVQSAEQSSGVETDLAARIVNANGTMLPAFNLTPWIGNQYRPHAAWDGNQFVVVYNEQKNRFAAQTLDELDATSDLFGIRLDSVGNVLDPAGFAFSLSRTAESHPAIDAANGVSLMAASVLRNEPFAAYRVGYQRFGTGGNQWPIAVAGADTGGGDVPLSVGFSAAGSSDPDGALSAYLWDFGDGATSTQADPTHEYTTPGNYVVTVTVTDEAGASATNTVRLSVTAPNVPPVAMATGEPLSGPAPLSVTFYGEGSYDVDGALGNYEWNFSNGGSYFGSTAFQTFTQPGTYFAQLTVYDNRGGTGTDTVVVDVGPPNAAPVAMVSATPASGDAPLTVTFSSAGSNDPDGSIVDYAWDFDDGNTSSEADPVHVYASAGTYLATLTVTDNQGATDSASVTITVTGACSLDCLRSANILLVGRDAGARARIISRVVVTDENGVRVGNAIVTVRWTRPNGSQTTSAAYTNVNGLAPFSTIGPHGTYTLTVENIERIGQLFDPDNSVLSRSITY